MVKKVTFVLFALLVCTIVILSFIIRGKNRTIKTDKAEIERLKEEKNQLSFTFEVINYRRIRRDSLAEINSKKYDEQIRLLDHANDSLVTATVRRLIAE